MFCLRRGRQKLGEHYPSHNFAEGLRKVNSLVSNPRRRCYMDVNFSFNEERLGTDEKHKRTSSLPAVQTRYSSFLFFSWASPLSNLTQVSNLRYPGYLFYLNFFYSFDEQLSPSCAPFWIPRSLYHILFFLTLLFFALSLPFFLYSAHSPIFSYNFNNLIFFSSFYHIFLCTWAGSRGNFFFYAACTCFCIYDTEIFTLLCFL